MFLGDTPSCHRNVRFRSKGARLTTQAQLITVHQYEDDDSRREVQTLALDDVNEAVSGNLKVRQGSSRPSVLELGQLLNVVSDDGVNVCSDILKNASD